MSHARDVEIMLHCSVCCAGSSDMSRLPLPMLWSHHKEPQWDSQSLTAAYDGDATQLARKVHTNVWVACSREQHNHTTSLAVTAFALQVSKCGCHQWALVCAHPSSQAATAITHLHQTLPASWRVLQA
jgi:hypothetical protein